MVGVPGRSKGCNTCISRKVKCDGGQPSCGNCSRSNRLCTGYKRPVAFVMSSDVKFVEPSTPEDGENTSVITHGRWRKRNKKAAKALPNNARGGPHATAAQQLRPEDMAPLAVDLSSTLPEYHLKQIRKRYPTTEAYDERLKTAQEEEMTAVALRNWRSAGPGNPQDTSQDGLASLAGVSDQRLSHMMMSFSQPMSADPAWREQLYPLFLRIHLPAEVFQGCKGSQHRIHRNWLMNLRDTAFDESPALETAMTALCMARVGRKDMHQGLINHSLDLYTDSLRHLQKALHDPKLQTSDQTLAACVALSMYEVAECPSKKQDGYASHQSGGIALLQKRGPEAHASVLGHSLFVFLRVQHFLYSLWNRKSNFLSEPEWRTKPWQSQAKDPHDMFMEQMYCIPVLMEKTDILEKSMPDPDTLLHGYKEIISQYQALHNCLQGWYRDLRAIVAGPLYGPELATIKCPELEKSGRGQPFPVAFHFPAFSVGQSMILYWCVAMVTNTQMSELHRKAALIEDARQTETNGSRIQSTHSSPTSSRSASPSSQPLSPHMAAAAETAAVGRSMSKNICQSIEFFLSASMGDLGAVSMLLPLIAVRHHLQRAHERGRSRDASREQMVEQADSIVWVDHMIKLIGRKGYMVAFYLDE